MWTALTVEPQRRLLYVGVDNSYTDVPASRTDSILALCLDDGHIAWGYQFTANDNYVVGCERGSTGNCLLNVGPDIDPAASPILRTLPGDRQLLRVGSKSGLVHALDPDSGKQQWEARVGVGSALGGIQWGSAADTGHRYAAVSDITVADGKGAPRSDGHSRGKR